MCGPFKNEGKQIMILKILSSIDASKSIWYWINWIKTGKTQRKQLLIASSYKVDKLVLQVTLNTLFWTILFILLYFADCDFGFSNFAKLHLGWSKGTRVRINVSKNRTKYWYHIYFPWSTASPRGTAKCDEICGPTTTEFTGKIDIFFFSFEIEP